VFHQGEGEYADPLIEAHLRGLEAELLTEAVMNAVLRNMFSACW
jgi:hypothetical protein